MDNLRFLDFATPIIIKPTDWQNYEVILPVPTESIFISIGVRLGGKGKILIDNLIYEVVERKISPEDCSSGYLLP